MKLTVLMLNGSQLSWDEPKEFNFLMSIPMWRSAGYIQAPHFYISMHAVAAILTDGSNVHFSVPHGQTVQ